jgi:hypothetical protein
MVSPLISALLGAGEQYMADEDASDKLKGDIIDGVSKKYFDVELPAQKNTINAMKEVKDAITRQYGDKIADIGDNYGFYEDGNIERAIERINKFIATTRDTTQTFRNKVEKMSPEDFASAFGKTSMIGAREQSLEDRESRVNDIFSDRSNVRDLLVSPDAPQGGVRGFLFGDRLKQKDVISARGKLEKGIEDRPPEIEQVDRQSIFDVKTGAVQEASATVADSIPLFLPAIPKYSTNELNTEIAQQMQVGSVFDQASQTLLLQPEAQRMDEVNAVKEVAINNLYRFKESDGSGNVASAIKFARSYLQTNVDDFLSGNFTNYAKAQEGAFGPIQGTAVGIQDKLVTAAEEFAANSGDKTLMDADQAFKIVSYLADRAEQFVGNDDTISYYLESIPQIALPASDPNRPNRQIKNLRFAVQTTYNKNNARGR